MRRSLVPRISHHDATGSGWDRLTAPASESPRQRRSPTRHGIVGPAVYPLQRNELHVLKFNPQIDVGSMVTASAVLCSLAAWLVTAHARDQQSVRDLATVQSAVSAQITDLRNVISSGLVDVHQQISTLPDQRARLDQVERRLSDLEAKLNNGDQHLGLLERATIETRADLNTLMRAANAPLLPLIGRSNRP